MKYGGIILNDMSAAPGISLTFFVQGCPIHCKGCHNPELQSFSGGKEFTEETMKTIIEGLTANNIKRSFCVMGGEPLCQENLFLTHMVIQKVKDTYPDIPIYIWTGYTLEELVDMRGDVRLQKILPLINTLIEGPYIEEQRDTTLSMRGSKNQRVFPLDLLNKLCYNQNRMEALKK